MSGEPLGDGTEDDGEGDQVEIASQGKGDPCEVEECWGAGGEEEAPLCGESGEVDTVEADEGDGG